MAEPTHRAAMAALFGVEFSRALGPARRSLAVTLAVAGGAWWLEGPQGETAAIALGALAVMYLFPMPMALLRDRHDGTAEHFAELPVPAHWVAWARIAAVWALTLPAALQMIGSLWWLEPGVVAAVGTPTGLVMGFGVLWGGAASVGSVLAGAMARWGMERLALWPFALWISALLFFDRMQPMPGLGDLGVERFAPLVEWAPLLGLLGVGLAIASAHAIALTWLTSALQRCVPGVSAR